MSRAVMSLALAAALAATAIPAAVAAPGDAPAPAPAAEGLRPRVPGKPDPVETPRSDAPVRIQIKLKEGSTARRDGAGLPVADGHTVAGLAKAGRIADLRPLVPGTVEAIRELKRSGEERSGEEQADMSLWLAAKIAPGDAMDVLERLNSDPDVELAELIPAQVSDASAAPIRGGLPSAVPSSTPDLTGAQGYAGPAREYGIGARPVAGLPGGKGENIRVVDIEQAWDPKHEDLTSLDRADALILNGTPVFPETSIQHGTAVMGELVGDENTGGVTGLVPKATPHYVNVNSQEVGYSVAAAIIAATPRLQAGDVLLLEQQVKGCGGDWAPVEVNDATYDAIKTAVAKGIHVVEAAGNGTQNLDDPCYGGASFPGGRGDSGAIIVGAAAGTRSSTAAGTRLGFSNFGQRVDLHGWGEQVTTTGYNGAFDGGPHRNYTYTFNGTSSASPIVAGAVGLVQSIAEAKGKSLTPNQMRTLLRDTGQAGVAEQKIGKLPNVPEALRAFGIDAPASPVYVPSTLVNGDFEQGSVGWSGATAGITTLGYPAATGSYKAVLGGHGRTRTEYIEAPIQIGTANPGLEYSLRVVTKEATSNRADDRLRVELVDAAGTVLADLGGATNLDASGWYSGSGYSLADFAGRTLRVRFTSVEDSSNATTFLVDTVTAY